MTTKFDLGWKNGGLGRSLSNFYPYPFIMDGVECGSMEGWFQSIKFSDPDEQSAVATLTGYDAYKIGQSANNWRDAQILWWRGKEYPRASRAYKDLVQRAYDECFNANQRMQDMLLQTGADVLTHVIGNHDQTMTVLTETEYIFNMYRLRSIAMQRQLGL